MSDASEVDIIVIYKLDRLSRSMADEGQKRKAASLVIVERCSAGCDDQRLQTA